MQRESFSFARYNVSTFAFFNFRLMKELKLLKDFIDLYYRISLEDLEVNLTNEKLSLRFLEGYQTVSFSTLSKFLEELNTIIEIDLDKVILLKDTDNLDLIVPFKKMNYEKEVN